MCSKSVCDDYVKSILSKNDKLRELFGSETNKLLITCRKCDNSSIEGNARAFLFESPSQIVLCTNRLQLSDIEEVLIHESVHAFDYFRNRCDFTSCDGLAFSEVRAAREAECKNSFSIFKESCIKDHATRSTANLFPKDNARQCVDRVYEAALKDLTPFDNTKALPTSPVIDSTPVISASQTGAAMPYSSLFGPPRQHK